MNESTPTSFVDNNEPSDFERKFNLGKKIFRFTDFGFRCLGQVNSSGKCIFFTILEVQHDVK